MEWMPFLFPPECVQHFLSEQVLSDEARSLAAGRWGSWVYIGFGDGEERLREAAALLTLDHDVVPRAAAGGCCPWQSWAGCLPPGAQFTVRSISAASKTTLSWS